MTTDPVRALAARLRDEQARELTTRLRDANATIEALLSGQIDAVVDSRSQSPVLLHKAQDALRESEERYRRIVETTSEGICTTDLHAMVTFVNRRLTELLGCPEHQLLGRSLFDFLPAAARTEAAVRADRSPGLPEDAEVGFVRRDGSELWAHLKTSPLLDANGRHLGRLVMITDRTRQRQDEQALRKSEEQYRQIVETTTDGILKIDARARIVFANRRFAVMLGLQPHEVIGIGIRDVMSAASYAVAVAAMADGATRRTSLDISFRHQDGSEISTNVAGARLLDPEGGHAGYLGLVRDMTERQKLQSQLMVSDRMASVGTLAAGVAHEINNPLAAVIANLDYIAEVAGRTSAADARATSAAWLRDEIESPLADARDAAQRVRLIVRDLKIFSRSPTEEHRGPVDVRAIMESSLRMAWNEVRHRSRLVKDYGAVPAVAANEGRLGQVFLNLIVNAAQSMQEGHAEHNEIRVVTRAEGDRVLVEVSDTGAGIPPEILGRIFDAFFTTKAVGVGTGLGLAICHRIVTDMGGTLTVESELGKGTRFRVSLPVAGPDLPVVAVAAGAAPAAGRRGQIMVVDDEPLVANGIRRTLARFHDVLALTSAKDALARCAAGETFDLILCDLMMPDMSGMELHRELTRVNRTQAGRMIFMTGGAFTSEARQFLETPMEHLEKPFDSANLRALVQRYLRE